MARRSTFQAHVFDRLERGERRQGGLSYARAWLEYRGRRTKIRRRARVRGELTRGWLLALVMPAILGVHSVRTRSLVSLRGSSDHAVAITRSRAYGRLQPG